MASLPFTQMMAETILGAEVHGSRFERFCVDLFREIDGVEYLPTSTTWDLGANGKSAQRHAGQPSPLIVCSLQKDVLTKFEGDIRRLGQNYDPAEILACSNQSLSDHGEEQIRQGLLKVDSRIQEVRIQSLEKLAKLCTRYSVVFSTHYSAELADLKEALSVDDDNPEQIQISGMRIALTTQLGNDAQTLRDDLIRNTSPVCKIL